MEDLEQGVQPKKCIIFCRGNGVLGEIHSRIMELTKFRFKDCKDAPFVMNHASLLPVTEKVLAERASEISLYLSSNKMLLGIDLDKIDVVIFIRPYNQLAALVQGGGRGGRRNANGKRSTVQVYQLFNSQDLTSRNKLMSPAMRNICFSTECTRKQLVEYFVGNSEPHLEVDLDGRRCCHSCDMKLVS